MKTTSYTITTYDLQRNPIRQTRHTSLQSLWRYYQRALANVHPEGRGPQKPWSGYVSIRDDHGTRLEMDRDSTTGHISMWTLD